MTPHRSLQVYAAAVHPSDWKLVALYLTLLSFRIRYDGDIVEVEVDYTPGPPGE